MSCKLYQCPHNTTQHHLSWTGYYMKRWHRLWGRQAEVSSWVHCQKLFVLFIVKWPENEIKSQYEWIWSQQWHKKHQLEVWGLTGTATGKVEGQIVRKKTQNQQVCRRFTGWLSLMFAYRVPVNPGKCPTRTRVFALFHSFKLGPAKQLIKEPLCPVISGNYVQI